MPLASTWVPETYESITRPVALDIVRAVTKMLGMDPNISVLAPGEMDQIAQAGSTIDGSHAANNNFFPSMEKVLVEIQEDADETRALTTPTLRREYLSIFSDPLVETSIWPVYSYTEMTLTFKYRAANRTRANRWRDDIRLRYARGRVENLHEIHYNYGIPYQFITLLKEIWTKREAVDGYGDTFEAWLKKNLVPEATVLSTLDGKQGQLVIPQTQAEVIGWFNFDMQPQQIEKENDLGAWAASFEYHILYDKVLQCGAHYPLVVHNQLIGKQFRDSNVPYMLSQTKTRGSLSQSFAQKLTPQTKQKPYTSMPWIRIPSFDDWIPRFTPDATSNLMTFLLLVEETDPTLLVNMKDLGFYSIDDDVMEYMAGESPYLGNYRQSLFNFTLFEKDTNMPGFEVTMDGLYNVKSSQPLDRRKHYHLRWAMMNDLTMMVPSALERFCNHGKAAVKLLYAIGQALKVVAPIPALQDDNTVILNDVMVYAKILNTARRRKANSLSTYGLPLYIGSFVINTERAHQVLASKG